MNPIYKFELAADGTTQRAFPIYKNDLAKDFEKESGQEFFRAKLSGNLTFESNDYAFIVSKAFDTQFLLEIFISYDAGQTWTSYWRGNFWKTDCEFDEDTQTVTVKPTVLDQYNDVLAGMDKEYNLIELSPAITPVRADKRPMIQVYVPGQSVIGCFLSGMWWEQEATPESNTTRLETKYRFSLNKTLRIVDVEQTGRPVLPDLFSGDPWASGHTDKSYDSGDYRFLYAYYGDSTGQRMSWQIQRISDGVILWSYELINEETPGSIPYTVTLEPVSGTGASGTVTLYIHDLAVYARIVCDTPTIDSSPTFPIPDDDIVENNRNYTRVFGYNFPDSIHFSTLLTSTPTPWGIYQPGLYYEPPYLSYNPDFFPVARNAWGRVSIWYSSHWLDLITEESARQQFTIRDAFPISSVISVLLGKIAPGITHEATTDFSQFLYGQNLIGLTQTLIITPKSNIITAGYDQPAQKAPITLKNVLDMLRDCFRCYWFIDEQNRFRVEHIQYFRNGGSYSDSPAVGIDLTQEIVPRNGKPWSYARNQYKFEKPEMAARYQFGWMDDVTELFDGYPIDIVSKYVNRDNVEKIDISKFTSDIDYILLNPGEISKDGFVLLSGEDENYLESPIVKSGTTTSGVIFSEVNLEKFIGRVVTINVESSVANTKIAQSDAIAELEEIGTLAQANTTYSFTFKVTQPFLIMYNDGVTFTGTLSEIYGIYYKLPYFNYVVGVNNHYLQNGYAAFCFLQQYYAYDMPALWYDINGFRMRAKGTKKLKNQTLRFPLLYDPDLLQFVRTNIGDGMIGKISVNLSSRNANATLQYDTD